MLSGIRDSAASHATADTAKTSSPSSTHGEVAARSASDPPSRAARAEATCMPCLSITCPVAAAATANSSSATFVIVNWRLPGRRAGAGAAGRASWRSGVSESGDFGIRRFLTLTAAAELTGILAVGAGRLAGLALRLGRGAGRPQPRAHRRGLEVQVGVAPQPVLVQPVLRAGTQHAEAVPDAPAQDDRCRVGLVA